MLKQTKGSRAVAEAVAMCRPEVICASAVGINSVERFLADEALRQGRPPRWALGRLEGSRRRGADG